jgi:hypothetical protein
MDAQQFAKFEEEVLAEHKRELEMLHHLKNRFVHGRTNGSSAISQIGAANATPKKSSNITLINSVADIMARDQGTWDAPKMLEYLSTVGVPSKATTINRILRKLVERGKIKRVKKGEGRNPNIYKAVLERKEVLE